MNGRYVAMGSIAPSQTVNENGHLLRSVVPAHTLILYPQIYICNMYIRCTNGLLHFAGNLFLQLLHTLVWGGIGSISLLFVCMHGEDFVDIPRLVGEDSVSRT